MALNQVQQVALELLKSKDITVKEAYALAAEFLNETGYLDDAQPLEVNVKFQAAMSDFEQWSVRMDCKALDIQVSFNSKSGKKHAYDTAKSMMADAIKNNLARSGKKMGEVKYIDRDDIRQWM